MEMYATDVPGRPSGTGTGTFTGESGAQGASGVTYVLAQFSSK